MIGPHCASAATTERPDRTDVGDRCCRCHTCQRGFNERIGTPYHYRQYPTDVVSLVVLWRVRYMLSRRDRSEMVLPRGIIVSHETGRAWERTRAPLLREALRKRRHGAVGQR